MADKIYNKRNISINAPKLGAIAPQTFDKQVGALAGVVDKKFQSLAKDNYAMGHAIAINNSIKSAYEAAPNDPNKFMELSRTNLDAFKKTLPGSIQTELDKKYTTASLSALTQVESNYKKTQLNEFMQKNNVLLNQNVGQYNFALAGEFQASLDRDSENEQKLIESRRNAYNTQVGLANAKLTDGTNVYTSSQIKAITSKDGQKEAFQNAIFGSNLKQLKKYDSEVFQNREMFMTDHDLDAKIYDSMSSLMGQRLKALGDSEKRIVKSQAYFDAQQSIIDQDPVVYNELMNNDVLDDTDKMIMGKVKAVYDDENTTRQGVKDALMLEKTLVALNESTNDIKYTNDQHKAIQAWGNFSNQFQNLATSTGMDVENKRQTLEMARIQFTEPALASSLSPLVSESTAIGSLIRSAIKESEVMNNPAIPKGWNQGIGMSQYNTFSANREIDKSMNAAKQAALDYGQTQIKVASDYYMIGNKEMVDKTVADMNREVMKIKNYPLIPAEEFDRLEMELENNRPAITKIAGVLYEFKGYSNQSPILVPKG